MSAARLSRQMRAALESQEAQQVVAAALAVLEERAKYERCSLSSPSAMHDYLRLRLGGLEHEVFACVFLDAQHRVIDFEELFRGGLTQMSVFPREVVKRALQVNVAAVIFAHNHPSGVAEPSQADLILTETLKPALALVDLKVLDRFIVGGAVAMSFSERGLL